MTPRTATRSRPPSTAPSAVRWWSAALVLTALLSLLVLLLPLSTSARSSVGDASTGGAVSEPAGDVREVRENLVRREGWPIAAVLLIPVLLCAAPLLVPGPARRPVAITAAGLLGLGCLVSAASVGLFYLPGAALLAVGATRRRQDLRPTAAPSHP